MACRVYSYTSTGLVSNHANLPALHNSSTWALQTGGKAHRVYSYTSTDLVSNHANLPAPHNVSMVVLQAGGRAGVRRPREYVPAYRSGPYAVLLTLFRHAQVGPYSFRMCHSCLELILRLQ